MLMIIIFVKDIQKAPSSLQWKLKHSLDFDK